MQHVYAQQNIGRLMHQDFVTIKKEGHVTQRWDTYDLVMTLRDTNLRLEQTIQYYVHCSME